tara:strand:- start:540 stop:728 length:189 start_codon:yes stop_codon:yes gene_type:complete
MIEEDRKNVSEDLHTKIINDIFKITGKPVPIMIQTKNGKLAKIKIDSDKKVSEIENYISSLE